MTKDRQQLILSVEADINKFSSRFTAVTDENVDELAEKIRRAQGFYEVDEDDFFTEDDNARD